jgi:tRNA (mo5U34)-methyltransferase
MTTSTQSDPPSGYAFGAKQTRSGGSLILAIMSDAIDYDSWSRDDLIRLAAKLKWVHQIDLGNGFVTPGQWPRHPQILKPFGELEFRGKKVLDVGCWDGLYAFEAEQRGASEVYATDLLSQRPFADHPTFAVARAALKSRVKYFPQTSVYDVEQLGVRDFDIVLFSGVYYHLKDPLRALAMLRRVVKDGAQIFVEGAVLNEPGCYVVFHYRTPYAKDYSNWWVPTAACLRQWVECSFFDVGSEYGPFGGPEFWRMIVVGSAVRRRDRFYGTADELLYPFAYG